MPATYTENKRRARVLVFHSRKHGKTITAVAAPNASDEQILRDTLLENGLAQDPDAHAHFEMTEPPLDERDVNTLYAACILTQARRPLGGRTLPDIISLITHHMMMQSSGQ